MDPVPTPRLPPTSPPAPPVHRHVELDLDPDAAWRLVGTEEGLASWLGREVRLDPTPGGGLRVVDDDGTVRQGRVTEAEPGRSLGFEWTTGEGDEEVASAVTITIEPAGTGSRVSVVEQLRGGRVAACLDAGAAWDLRLEGLELRVLLGGRLPLDLAPV